MPLHFRENQYNGVNAHLHSVLQREGWQTFHSAHITHMTTAIDALLPEQYYAVNEDSLQLDYVDLTFVERRSTLTRTDVSIYGEPGSSPLPGTGTSATPTATFPILEMRVEEEPMQAILIYERADETLIPVTRIELLSPANKPRGSHYRKYIEKRMETLAAGINLVEIDYLHESRPILPVIPSYIDRETNAHPYTICVSNPHPNLKAGRTAVYGFGIDAAIPIIDIPLAADDIVTIDFGTVYNLTFASSRYYGTILVDYEQLPVNFESYSEADQQRIHDRMRLVQAKQ